MANPVLRESVFDMKSASRVSSQHNLMTINGCVTKTIGLCGLLAVVALITASQVSSGSIFGMPVNLALIAGGIIGFVAVLAGVFVPRIAAPAAVVYALAKGVVIGIVSAYYGMREGMHGLPLMAAALTFTTLMGMLILYQLRIIRVNQMFRTIIIGATFGLVLGIGVLWLLSIFGMGTGLLTTLYGNGPIGIGFSLFCVALASFNLALDFDFIERGAGRAEKRYEWVAALGLMVTLVWLYLEILRLLAKLRSE